MRNALNNTMILVIFTDFVSIFRDFRRKIGKFQETFIQKPRYPQMICVVILLGDILYFITSPLVGVITFNLGAFF